ncbi:MULTISPECIES: NAD-dependent protein deacetylase [Lysobacter]|uniref:NAD-dependent protein deacetylase n=1 Tax=Lysobacter TaxID=68 RepID=UPI001F1AB7E9|nr:MULTISPECIES: NAD-dependent protein deacetylase [Lysobacter]UJB20986.1 NAD-dependent protein deacetylase [Lysobacter capsici]UJQ29899.1 NAD-dependent protein deacetylase [Lysobacter gummosus]
MNLSTAHDSHTAAQALYDWLRPHRRVFVLTGAGISTDSGIPHYRDESGAWQRKPPIDLRAFVGDARARSRYWARSFVGWPSFSGARPNAGHDALARWQQREPDHALVTQNVDGLHARAGSLEVVDLHGCLDEVICLDCGARQAREALQQELAQRNPDWVGLDAAALPDGDADLQGLDFDRFHTPVCAQCGGMVKPDVVFFGENVPRARVAAAQQSLAEADAMLVVGSSLMVYSGFRFARAAREAGLPLALLNRGVTRADEIATLKLQADCGATLQAALA